MTLDVQFTDEELTAYLDGEADDALHLRIDAALEADVALGARLAELDIPLDHLRADFDALLAEAPAAPDLSAMQATAPQAMAPQAANLNRGLGWGGGLAVFGTGIAAGVAMMMFTAFGTPPAPPAPGWKAVVASYQSLYSAQTLAGKSPTEAEAQAQLAAVSAVVGADLTTLPEVEGLTFKRAQLLGFNGKPLVQIAFARADGTPVALCIIAANSDAAKTMQAETLQGMAAASWNRAGLAYLLIGGADAAAVAGEADGFEAWVPQELDV